MTAPPKKIYIYDIDATIRIGLEIQCLPHTRFCWGIWTRSMKRKVRKKKIIFFRRELFRRPHLRTELPYFNQHADQSQVLPVDNLI